MKTLVLALLAATPAWAQTAGGGQSFSLQQAVQYGLQNSVQVKNANTDVAIAKAKVGEIRSIGLPQLNGAVQYSYNIRPQQFVIEYDRTSQFTSQLVALNPQLAGKPTGIAFAIPHALSASISGSQLLFSPSYLLGLKAAATYTQLSDKQLEQTRISVKGAITKAYYQALVGQQQMELLNLNIKRLDTTLKQTQALFKSGFAEQIDVYRLEVSRNNLISERDNAQRLVELGVSALKFQMGYPSRQPLVLTDRLQDMTVNADQALDGGANYDQRIDYQILNVQEQLAKLDLKSKRAGYIPTLAAFGTLGANTAANQFGNLFNFRKDNYNEDVVLALADSSNPENIKPEQRGRLKGQRWYPSFIIGLTLNVPIFDGFQKKYQIQQAKLALRKVADSRELVKSSIDLQVDQANITTKNALGRLTTQQRNLDLAKEVVRVTRVKYRSGVGSSLEVTNAETDLRLAQTNYYTALYDAMVASVDADIAAGRINAQ